MKAAAGIRAVALLAGIGTAGFADAADLHIYTTGAPSLAVKSIAADFTERTGHHLTFTVAQPAVIQHRLAAGGRPDIVILPTRVVTALQASGALRAGSAVDLARVGIGIVVRKGAQPPDISSPAAVRKLLLDAGSIVYPDPQSGGGSAGRAIARMIDQMGCTDAVGQKLTLESAIGGGVDLVADGKADVGLFNISEIIPIRGVTLVGPLPPALQTYIVFSGAIPASNPAPQQAASFIKALADPAARQAWRQAGLEPLPADRSGSATSNSGTARYPAKGKR